MIPLHRPPAPASLASPKIRQYLDACAAYSAACAVAPDPVTVARPEKPTDYRNSDVLEAFERHFHGKCYLTEQWLGAYEMDVDHFVPFNENPALAYDWENLFPIAHKANMMRPRKWPSGGLLNPCRDAVQDRIVATIGVSGQAPRFAAADDNDRSAVNTAALLNLLHNGNDKDQVSVDNTKHLRVTIAEQYDRILRAIISWKAARDGSPQQRANARRKLEDLLSHRAPFTMLMRSIDVVVEHVPKEFLQ